MGKCYGIWHRTNRIYQTKVELLKNENNRLRMESESWLKTIELLSVQQINTHEAHSNTENFITVKETSKNKKIKLNHQQDSRIPLRNSSEILPIEEYQGKPEPIDEENSMSPSFDYAPNKEGKKSSQLNTNNQTLTLPTTNMKNPFYRGKDI